MPWATYRTRYFKILVVRPRSTIAIVENVPESSRLGPVHRLSTPPHTLAFFINIAGWQAPGSGKTTFIHNLASLYGRQDGSRGSNSSSDPANCRPCTPQANASLWIASQTKPTTLQDFKTDSRQPLHACAIHR